MRAKVLRYHREFVLRLELESQFKYSYKNQNENAGGVFVEKDAPVELAFRYAIDRANMYSRTIELIPQSYYVGPEDSFKMMKTGNST